MGKVLVEILKPMTISDKYRFLGGEEGFLGRPLSEEKQGPNGGLYREYVGGNIYWHSDKGAFVVHGKILEKYLEQGAFNSPLGYPITDVIDFKHVQGGICVSFFQSGLVSWKPDITPEFSRAYELHGDILDKFYELNDFVGPLGYPLSDVLDVGDQIGKYCNFISGSIYWSTETKAHALFGEILKKYTAIGGPKGLLGYPLSDDSGLPDGVGRYNHFQRGTIIHSPLTGTHEVHGPIRDKYAELGWEGSSLGYLVSDVFQIPGTDNQRSCFEGGIIDNSPSTGVSLNTMIFSEFVISSWGYYEIPPGWIRFFPKIINVGNRDIIGPGTYVSGVSAGHHIFQTQPRDLSINFVLKPGEEIFLGPGIEGVTLNHEELYYNLVFRFEVNGKVAVKTFLPSIVIPGRSYGDPMSPQSGSWIENHTEYQCTTWSEFY
jgi:hypothetical protein